MPRLIDFTLSPLHRGAHAEQLPQPNRPEVEGRFPAGWIDAQGNLWIFGGHGYDPTGNVGQLNDVWMYKP